MIIKIYLLIRISAKIFYGAIFKLRIKNSDISKEKSGGYRLIYYCQTATGIILLTIYTKSEQVKIAAEDIKQIILQIGKLIIKVASDR